MARPRGQVVVKWDVRQTADTSARAFARAAKETAAEMEAYVKRLCSRPNPPPGKNPSRPGQYPKQVWGEFVSGIHVSGTVNGITVQSEAPHGVFLEEGTVNMDPRPWATKMVFARDWAARIAKRAREYTGGSRKPPRSK